MVKLADRGELPLRVYAMADGDSKALAWLCDNGPQHHRGGHLEFRALKLYVDGALGSRGAALLEDYADDKGNRGLLVTAPDALERLVARARECKLQVATHAIGDRGNSIVLDAYAKALPAAERDAARWRIEHAQVVAVEDIARFAQQHVIASMQPTHATSDMPWAEARVGPRRIVGAYSWRMMRDAGVRLALGSDFPVESVDPRLGLYSAVARADADGKPAGGWRSEEKLTAYEALRGFTLDAAYAGFAEKEVGSLEAGKRADFVLLGADPLTVAPERLRDLPVIATYVDGKQVFEARRD
jgi:predicted amidohydrolase YtcJ